MKLVPKERIELSFTGYESVVLPLNYIGKKWCAGVDLNHRPHPYQGCALTKLSYTRENWSAHKESNLGLPLIRGLLYH
jgi:hypothetical protein